MGLNVVWFVLIMILYTGFFILEGFDFGVGILLPFLAKNDTERRAVINTIGPHWDGNEVWLLTAGGATFAAFPHWYATLFSGFYLPLFLMLVALIVRGVAFEFRSKDENPLWRKSWDWAIFASSLTAPFLLGVAFSNIVRGVPIDQQMHYAGGFFNLLNPYALLGGAALVLVCAVHGALFLSLKTTQDLLARARLAASTLWFPAVVVFEGYVAATLFDTDILPRVNILALILVILAGAALLAAGWLIRRTRLGLAFVATAVGIAAVVFTFFSTLYPRVMISSLDPAWSLTIANAASGPYTLKVMTIVAAIFVPVVLAYTIWSYWVFRKRVESKPENLTY